MARSTEPSDPVPDRVHTEERGYDTTTVRISIKMKPEALAAAWLAVLKEVKL